MAGGVAVAGLGAFSLGLGLLHSPLLPETLGGMSGAALASVMGFVLVIAGIMLSIFTFRALPEQAPVIPAHVAFMTRTAQPLPMPERIVIPARRPGPARPVESQRQMSRLDEEIRELTRKINKAGVMLATGQISHQGYASYVDDLKKQRGKLEASRVRLELHRD